MGDEDEGGAGVRDERVHRIERLRGAGTVQVAGGFISEHHGRAAGQRPRHGNTLAFTAREFVWTVLDALRKADGRQQGAGVAGHFAKTGAGHETRHGDVLQRRELRQQVVQLVDKAHVQVAQRRAAPGPGGGDVLAANANRAGVRVQQPGQDVQQGALAHPGTPDDGQALPGRHVKTHAGEHVDAGAALGIVLGDAAATEGWRVTHASAPRLG